MTLSPSHGRLPRRSLRLAALLAAAGLGLLGVGAAPGPATEPVAKPFAVVELFTSEGCSSCPPADALLSKLAAEARQDGRAVYFIAYHVDYWDNLGWKDPFASRAHTDRQYAYARALSLPSVYTPQLIINGNQAEFVGSDEPRARKEIKTALTKLPAAAVSIKPGKPPGAAPDQVPGYTDGLTLSLTCRVTGAAKGDELRLVAVERGLETEVRRGENAGRKLRHDNVARAVATATLPAGDSERNLTLTLPPGSNPANTEVIAFVQAAGTGAIRGAGTTHFPQKR